MDLEKSTRNILYLQSGGSARKQFHGKRPGEVNIQRQSAQDHRSDLYASNNIESLPKIPTSMFLRLSLSLAHLPMRFFAFHLNMPSITHPLLDLMPDLPIALFLHRTEPLLHKKTISVTSPGAITHSSSKRPSNAALT